MNQHSIRPDKAPKFHCHPSMKIANVLGILQRMNLVTGLHLGGGGGGG